MSYLVLARKYRPQTFEDVVRQEHVTKTLSNAIDAGRVAHAILFAGPRGTGKTTIARILAKAMNCTKGPIPEPCNKCKACREITSGNSVDVLEIDGASNNGVEQIRELRENVNYMPAYSHFKIYIIDEVHMLSIAAFNALLKTLEEPPAHILFFFATTEPNKIPITILSRCQRHDLRHIDIEAIVGYMTKICKKEAVDIEKDKLALIAREGTGSMRDSLSLLDQVMSCAKDTISSNLVIDILGIIDRKIVFSMAEAIICVNTVDSLNILDDVYSRGHDIKKLYTDILEHFRHLLVISMGGNKLVDVSTNEIELMKNQIKGKSSAFLNQLFDIMFKHESVVRFSAQPKLAFEMILIKSNQIKAVMSIDMLIEKLDILKEQYDIIANKGLDIEDPACKSAVHSSTKEQLKNSEVPDKFKKDLNVDNKIAKIKNSDRNQTFLADLEKTEKLSTDKNANKNTLPKKDVNQKEEENLKLKVLDHPCLEDALEIFEGKIVDIKIL